jgi:hypothetical protein
VQRSRSIPIVISLIALFIALGTGAYAAITVPANSVGTAQLRNGAVTGSKVHDDTITGAKIKLGTLGSVPLSSRAGRASVADNADRLGGLPSSKYALDSQPPFIRVALLPGFTNFGSGYAPISYMKDTLGFVHLHGTMNCQAGPAVAFTLPAGYRPAEWLLTSLGTAPPGSGGRMDLAPNGNVWITATSDTTLCGLDGITFKAEQ